MIKFVTEIATVLLEIKITKYVGSLNNDTSKNLFGSFRFFRLQQKQQYATSATLSVMDFRENCDANSFGWSKADNVEPWKGVETYAKLVVDMFLLVELSRLLKVSVEPSFLASGTPSRAMDAELVGFGIGRVYDNFLFETLCRRFCVEFGVEFVCI